MVQTASRNKAVVMFDFLMFEFRYFNSTEFLYVGASGYLVLFGGA